MGLDYSYTQPSQSESYGLRDSEDSGYSSTQLYIRMDQAEIEATRNATVVQYPPQPEVEFGFPKECYCGGEPVVRTSVTRTEPGRRFYTCDNIDDGDMHVHKWWDVAATEEIKALASQCALLENKVDFIAGVSHYDSEVKEVRELLYDTELKLVALEQTVSELSKPKNAFDKKFEVILGGLVVVAMVMAVLVMFK